MKQVNDILNQVLNQVDEDFALGFQAKQQAHYEKMVKLETARYKTLAFLQTTPPNTKIQQALKGKPSSLSSLTLSQYEQVLNLFMQDAVENYIDERLAILQLKFAHQSEQKIA